MNFLPCLHGFPAFLAIVEAIDGNESHENCTGSQCGLRVAACSTKGLRRRVYPLRDTTSFISSVASA
jgi:hypothetical protein